MGQSVDIPQIPEQMGNAPVPTLAPIQFRQSNQQKALLGLINQKIERYNTLVQNSKKNNADAGFLLQEIEYSAHFLMNHSDPDLSGPGRNWYLTSGIAQQPGHFAQFVSQSLASEVQIDNTVIDFEKLFTQTELAGVDSKTVEALRAKLNSKSYQNSPVAIRN
ncbi:MAG: hypothetical protein K0R48_504, partial [Gammaproteobacteria bacterium]|nr:hypothetical protein [Gammaproteobacteria bacterium]